MLDRENNTFTITDNDTKRTVTAKAFTGGHTTGGKIISPGPYDGEIPAPNGTYNIVDNPNPKKGREDWFGLLIQDSRMDDYLDDHLNENREPRSGVRLHMGTYSKGCVTISGQQENAENKWKLIRDLLKETKKGEVEFITGPHFYNFSKKITNYGTLVIK